MKNINNLISEIKAKPPVFSRSKDVIWTDPYISKQLLECHVNLDIDAASRKQSFISDSIDFLIKSGYIKPGDKILDLGCGPGLYAESLAGKGVNVTGIDFSQNSINYAIDSAKKKNLDISYECGNILEIDYGQPYDAAMQIYGELNVFSPDELDVILKKIHKSLKPGGLLIFDVTTPLHRSKNQSENCWYTEKNGFWGAGENLILENGYEYPDENVWLDRFIVINENGYKDYRNWYRDYGIKTITERISNAGFELIEAYGDLTGKKISKDDEWIALVVRKN